MRRLAGIGAIILLLGSCARSPYDGYKLVGDDVHLHLHSIGDGEELASDSDSVHVRLRMGQVEGEVGGLFSTERAYLAKDVRMGAMIPVLRRMHVGDSLSVIAPAQRWPWEVFTEGMTVDHPDTGMVRLEVVLLELRTPADMRAEAERLRRNDPNAYEVRLINAYLQRSEVPFVAWGTSDIRYHLNGEPTDTMAVAQRDIVTISYQGRSLEGGTLFDDTERNGAPFTFTFGDKDQVIHGLEVAVSLLREGQEGTFLFPSLFAFGVKGIPGVLDPHTPVVYTVRLEKVERPARAGA
ncbi:MAG: FKBP-type peptidyl-prolyl cis-trans isomerase [Flavobacteriales bacterium]|nr:FKBP-type peptidyl-prolyl cis-trans isomerase [Flavobacteriales bacterium]